MFLGTGTRKRIKMKFKPVVAVAKEAAHLKVENFIASI
jgi:hypothetical protein